MAAPSPTPAHMREWIEAIAPETWHARRWFAGKSRRLAARSVRDLVLLPGDGPPLALALVDLTFAEGGGETYFIPLALAPSAREPSEETLLGVERDGTKWDLVDGVTEQTLGPALLKLLGEKTELPGEHGRFLFQATRAFDDIVGPATDLPVSVLPPLQSNSLVNYGDRALLKCMRRVRPGVNADLEVTYFLTTKTAFANIPRVAGMIEYVDEGHSHWPLAILQSYVENQGNAWELIQEDLREFYEQAAGDTASAAAALELIKQHSQTVYELGERTGELHAALASDESSPDFAPEPVTGGDWAKWAGALLQELKESFEMLRQRIEQLPADEQADCRRLSEREPAIAATAERLKSYPELHLSPSPPLRSGEGVGGEVPGSEVPAGPFKIRFHGDYHLGQVLVTRGDFVIIDFEGEPMRPIEQRRSKQLALKDVAGMLRSFNYAGYAALFETFPAQENQHRLEPYRRRWERAMRVGFLQGYRRTVASARVPLAPATEAGLQQLLDIFELEKALYELRYELSNRPDWVRIPVKGIRQIVG